MKVLILNKIKHKPLLLNQIFTFVCNRPYIFPYLIDSDSILKKQLKNTIEPMNKKNDLMKDVNENICKYIIFRLLYETNINTGEISDISLKNYLLKNITSEPSMINFFSEKIIQTFKKTEFPKNINIQLYKINQYLPSDEILINFFKDYLTNKNELILFYLPLINAKKEKDEIFNFTWTKEEIYSDSYFLNNLNKENSSRNQKISLICLLNNKEYYNDPMTVTYEKIKKLFFYLHLNDYNDYKNIFQNIYKYIIGIKHRENIDEILFSESFQNENDKNYFKYFIEDYLLFLKKIGEIDLNFYSLKKIEFNDDEIINNVERIQIRYYLNKIFGENVWCKLITINYKELENIDNLSENSKNDFFVKINSFEKEKTKHKILYINFENNSPFQQKIIEFFGNYVHKNKNINTIVINNLGNMNYDKRCYDKMKEQQKIKIPNLEQIIYDNNIFQDSKNDINNEIKYFISSLFDIEKLLTYEGYDNNNNLVYFNIFQKITSNEIKRVFKENKNIVSIKLVFENMEIKYEKNNKHLSVINIGKKGKEYLYYTPIKYFGELIKNFEDLKELTIDGFDFELKDILNKNIISLNINNLNYETLSEISNNIQKNKSNLKNINFYLKDSSNNNTDKIIKKLKKKNITLKIINFEKKENKKKNNNIKEEENEDYEDNEYEEDEDDENEYYDKYDDYDDEIVLCNIKTSGGGGKNKKNPKNAYDIICHDKNDDKIGLYNIKTNESGGKNSKNKHDIICKNVNSEILNSQNLSIIKKGFQSIYYNNKIKSIKFTIKYRASLDGNTLKDFIAFNLYDKNILLVVETNTNQIFGAYGYLKKNENLLNSNNFFFNIKNEELIKDNVSLTLNTDGISVYPYFKLGISFFKFNNKTKDDEFFSCKEVEVFDINLNLK